jgi:hypothetical protein
LSQRLGKNVSLQDLPPQPVTPQPAGEIPIDKGLIEPKGLEDLGAPLGAAAFRLYACRLQLFEGVDDPQPTLNNQPILHVF